MVKCKSTVFLFVFCLSPLFLFLFLLLYSYFFAFFLIIWKIFRILFSSVSLCIFLLVTLGITVYIFKFSQYRVNIILLHVKSEILQPYKSIYHLPAFCCSCQMYYMYVISPTRQCKSFCFKYIKFKEISRGKNTFVE